MAADSALIINEICASNKTIIADEDGEYVDWIELYNSGSEAINLKGYGLSDKSGKPMLWTFPDVTIEPAHTWSFTPPARAAPAHSCTPTFRWAARNPKCC